MWPLPKILVKLHPINLVNWLACNVSFQYLTCGLKSSCRRLPVLPRGFVLSWWWHSLQNLKSVLPYHIRHLIHSLLPLSKYPRLLVFILADLFISKPISFPNILCIIPQFLYSYGICNRDPGFSMVLYFMNILNTVEPHFWSFLIFIWWIAISQYSNLPIVSRESFSGSSYPYDHKWYWLGYYNMVKVDI